MIIAPVFRVPTNEFFQCDAIDLVDLVVDTGEVAHRTTLRPTDPGDGDFVVFVDERDGTVTGTERGDLFAVLDQLHSDALSDRRVGLFGLDADLFEYDTASLRCTLEWIGLLAKSTGAARVVRVGPPLILAVLLELPRGIFAVCHGGRYPTKALKRPVSTPRDGSRSL